MSQKPSQVEVEIFDQSYSVRGADPEHVKAVAAFVDKEMREVSRASGAVDSVRIAVLAALNIADELIQLRAEAGSGDGAAKETRERLEKLARELSDALEE